MKRFISILLAVCLLIITQYFTADKVLAKSDSTPDIAIEIADYVSEGVINERSGRAKTSATAGEKIVLTFILSGVDSLECYQLSGVYDISKLSAGYFTDSKWNEGDEEQDYDTIVAGSEDYSNSKLDDSFSYTRTIEEPYICLLGFSMTGTTDIEQGTKLISVGFKVLEDIDNIYKLFTWDENTMVGVTLEDEEYYIDSGLYIGCKHQFENESIAASCTQDGYVEYSCIYCNESYKTDYVSASGHNVTFIQKDENGFNYHCSACQSDVIKTSDDLLLLWKAEYINTQPEGFNDSQYLDVHSDNIINAKDYAIIKSN